METKEQDEGLGRKDGRLKFFDVEILVEQL